MVHYFQISNEWLKEAVSKTEYSDRESVYFKLISINVLCVGKHKYGCALFVTLAENERQHLSLI